MGKYTYFYQFYSSPRISFNAFINISTVTAFRQLTNRYGKHPLIYPDFQAAPHPYRHRTPENSKVFERGKEKERNKNQHLHF